MHRAHAGEGAALRGTGAAKHDISLTSGSNPCANSPSYLRAAASRAPLHVSRRAALPAPSSSCERPEDVLSLLGSPALIRLEANGVCKRLLFQHLITDSPNRSLMNARPGRVHGGWVGICNG